MLKRKWMFKKRYNKDFADAKLVSIVKGETDF